MPKKKQLEFKNITKVYPQDIPVLKDININLYQGDFAFLVGESGAGKSTLIKILIREEEPTEGEIYFNKQNILEIPKEDFSQVRRDIGVVFQDFKLLDSRSVFENVAIALEVVQAAREEINEIVPNVLSMVGLLDKRTMYPYQLSGGEKQRVSIARALAHEPDILVADEPTGMIDPEAGKQIMEILEDIAERGTTVLMATHDKDIVDSMKKRVIRIADGQIVSDKEGGKYHD